MQKIVWYVVVGAALICVSLTVLSYWKWGNGGSFWANFALNVVAEFVGMGFAAAAAALIAIWATKRKLEHAIESITRLRTDKVITGETARTAVVFTVGIISPELLRQARSSEPSASVSTSCRVCALPVVIADAPPERCKYCGLPRKSWKLPPARRGVQV
jgi:hypothetical protein